MQLRRALLLDPPDNAVWAVSAVALSLFVFAYSTIFGKVSVLAFYACWLPVLALEPRILLVRPGAILALLLLPGFAGFSTLWSDVSGATLRAAIQYSTTILCGLVAARLVPMPLLARGIVAGSLFVLLYSFKNGNYAYDVVDGSYAFAGAFASKNQLGYFASMALLCALSLIALYPSGWFWKAFSALVGALALIALSMADSATSTLTVLGALAIMGGGYALVHLPTTLRRIVIGLGIAAGAALMVVAWRAGVFAGILEIFGKDATLTGRTYLWQQGIEYGAQHPVAGLGYYAFWTPGRPEAEDLWRAFFITARTGFHFHNTLIEAYVGLGAIGCLLVIHWLWLLLVRSVRVMMNRERTASALLASGLAGMFVVRSMVEIDFYTPYTAGSFLVPYLIVQMSDMRAIERREWRARTAATPASSSLQTAYRRAAPGAAPSVGSAP